MQMCRLTLFTLLLFFLLSFPIHASNHHEIDFIVNKGDSLYRICQQLLEDPEDWRWVAMVNRINNPHRIFPGQKLIIPTRLLKGVPVDGVVTFLKGKVRIQFEASEAWRPIHLHDRIAQGNRIQTSKESVVEITYEHGFSIFLRPETTLEITTARKKSAIYLLYRLFIDAGRTISKIQQVTGNESRLEIQTPSTVAAPRGTAFRTAVDSAAATRLEILTGTVDVQAAKQQVEVKEGEGTLVEPGKAPATPRKLLPPPPPTVVQPLYRAMPLEFRFEKVVGASTYRVMLARENTFKDVVQDKVIKPHDTLQIVGVEDGVYFLQSRSIDGVGLEGPSLDPVEVKVRVNPVPPFIQSPAHEADQRETSVRFEWLKVGKVVRYHVQLAEDRDFTVIVEDHPDVNGLSHQTGNLDFKTYYFRISSIAADGYQGIWSDTLSVNIIPPPPSPPVEKAEVAGKEIHIRWRDLGGNITYHFQMAKDEAFTERLIDETLTKPEITLEKPKDVGTYYVRTSAIDAEGYEGAFSDPQTFDITSKFPYLPAGIVAVIILIIIAL